MITTSPEHIIIGSPTHHKVFLHRDGDKGFQVMIWPQGSGVAVFNKISHGEMRAIMEWVTQQPVPH